MLGVSSKVDELQERCKKLQEMCLARYEAGEKSQAFNQFQDKFNNVSIAPMKSCFLNISEFQLQVL